MKFFLTIMFSFIILEQVYSKPKYFNIEFDLGSNSDGYNSFLTIFSYASNKNFSYKSENYDSWLCLIKAVSCDYGITDYFSINSLISYKRYAFRYHSYMNFGSVDNYILKLKGFDFNLLAKVRIFNVRKILNYWFAFGFGLFLYNKHTLSYNIFNIENQNDVWVYTIPKKAVFYYTQLRYSSRSKL